VGEPLGYLRRTRCCAVIASFWATRVQGVDETGDAREPQVSLTAELQHVAMYLFAETTTPSTRHRRVRVYGAPTTPAHTRADADVAAPIRAAAISNAGSISGALLQIDPSLRPNLTSMFGKLWRELQARYDIDVRLVLREETQNPHGRVPTHAGDDCVNFDPEAAGSRG
jgi:hypothetical protein